MKNCCSGCRKREPTCHVGCEEYIAYKKSHDAKKAMEQKKRRDDGDIKAYFKAANLRRKKETGHAK